MDALNVTEHLLLLALVCGFTVFPWVSSEGNSTAQPETRSVPCPMYIENCSEISEPARWRGYFSRCPKSYKHYCVKGKCRFVAALKEPSCRCEKGYTGKSRCRKAHRRKLKAKEMENLKNDSTGKIEETHFA
ncbi:probetacellulin isoform X2 [Rana temporaria]|uniref:probetacellulin isoform X2 n=1 Tax=Rana temporaria TaxID=8407 RepID=UPI001AAC6B6B|nr:probetacellulin isoform X2 [Rana temporaria]